jgi:hypothetical protein
MVIPYSSRHSPDGSQYEPRGKAALDQRQRAGPVADGARKEEEIPGSHRLAERKPERSRRRQDDMVDVILPFFFGLQANSFPL